MTALREQTNRSAFTPAKPTGAFGSPEPVCSLSVETRTVTLTEEARDALANALAYRELGYPLVFKHYAAIEEVVSAWDEAEGMSRSQSGVGGLV